jgi:hypothetical protein
VKDQYIFEEANWFIQCVFCWFIYLHIWIYVTVCRSNRMMFGTGLFGTLGRLSASRYISTSWLTILWYKGGHHRKQRKMLNPVFSSSHLRDMLPIFYEITYKVCVFVVVSFMADKELVVLWNPSCGMLSHREFRKVARRSIFCIGQAVQHWNS